MNDRARRQLRILYVALFVIGVLIAGYLLSDIINPLLVALLIAYIMDPLLGFLERRKIPRKWAVIGIYVVGFLGILLFGGLLTKQVVTGVADLHRNTFEPGGYLDRLEDRLEETDWSRFFGEEGDETSEPAGPTLPPIEGEEPVTARVVASRDGVRPGDTFEVALVVDIEEGFGIVGSRSPAPYVPVAANIGQIPDVRAGLPTLTEPVKEPHEALGIMIFLHRGQMVARTVAELASDSIASEVRVEFTLGYQLCTEEGCEPVREVAFEAGIPVVPLGTEVKELHPEIFKVGTVPEGVDLASAFQVARTVGQRAGKQIRDVVLGVIEQAAAGVRGVMMVISYTILVPVYCFFLMLILPGMRKTGVEYLPGRYRDRVLDVLRKIDRSVSAFFRGRLLICLFKGIFIAVGLWICGIKFAIPIGLIAGVATLIPFLGGIVATVPSVIIALLEIENPVANIIGIFAVVILSEGFEGFVLTPIILSKDTGLHPLALLLALFIAGEVFGFFGVLLAVPIASIAKILFDEFVKPEIKALAKEKPQPSSGEG